MGATCSTPYPARLSTSRPSVFPRPTTSASTGRSTRRTAGRRPRRCGRSGRGPASGHKRGRPGLRRAPAVSRWGHGHPEPASRRGVHRRRQGPLLAACTQAKPWIVTTRPTQGQACGRGRGAPSKPDYSCGRCCSTGAGVARLCQVGGSARKQAGTPKRRAKHRSPAWQSTRRCAAAGRGSRAPRGNYARAARRRGGRTRCDCFAAALCQVGSGAEPARAAAGLGLQQAARERQARGLRGTRLFGPRVPFRSGFVQASICPPPCAPGTGDGARMRRGWGMWREAAGRCLRAHAVSPRDAAWCSGDVFTSRPGAGPGWQLCRAGGVASPLWAELALSSGWQCN